MSDSATGDHRSGASPSMLDLIRLSRRALFPPGGRELYRQIAILTDMGEGQEVLVASCGRGMTLEYFVREFGVQGSGADDDGVLIEQAEERSREEDLQERIQFQNAGMHDLPYRDGIFDVVVGELGLTAHTDPKAAVDELVRVTRPGGRVALVQLVWKAPVDLERQRVLSRHLGARPVMLVELKRMLREGGVERMHTEAWSDEETAFRPAAKKPFPDFAELFSLPEKVGILRRAWSRWGWRGVRTAVAREIEVHRLLTKERILGLDLVVGRRRDDVSADSNGEETRRDAVSGAETAGEAEAGTADVEPSAHGDPTDESAPVVPSESNEVGTEGLPLFTRGEER